MRTIAVVLDIPDSYDCDGNLKVLSSIADALSDAVRPVRDQYKLGARLSKLVVDTEELTNG